MSDPIHPIFTLGHSKHPIERLLALLEAHRISAVADVRSSPHSRFNPQFDRQALRASLKDAGIRYVFLGRELGARSEDTSCYERGRIQYDRLARTELFRAGLERVLQGAAKYRLALLCAEKEPLECHRTLLVARALHESGAAVQHILADGRLESHEDALERLLELVGLPSRDLFRSREELVAEALKRQEQRIAYVDERQAAQVLQEAG